jgi:hypothetical protein
MNVTTQAMATVVGGMLELDQTLPLPDRTRVRLTIQPAESQLDPMEAWQQLKAWIQEKQLRGLGRRLTRDELHERR